MNIIGIVAVLLSVLAPVVVLMTLVVVVVPVTTTVQASSSSSSLSLSSSSSFPGSSLLRQCRRFCNLSGTFGSVTKAAITSPHNSGGSSLSTTYDRVANCPVFSVTTSWGSPYLNMERITSNDNDEYVPTSNDVKISAFGDTSTKQQEQQQQEQEQEQNDGDDSSSTQSSTEDDDILGGTSRRRRNGDIDGRGFGSSVSGMNSDDQQRLVALYYMDIDDAILAHSCMKQMDGLKASDIQITTCNLARAIRQSSNWGHGYLTGVPPDPIKFGILPVMDLDGDGSGGNAALRYKIVPPKRQLYYASRCIGKERVGLLDDNPAADAQMTIAGNGNIFSNNAQRRSNAKQKNTRKMLLNVVKKKSTTTTTTDVVGSSSASNNSAANNANANNNADHMEGYTGIPVFYCPHMKRVHPILKRLISGCKHEIPLFMNYEDLQESYHNLIVKDGKYNKNNNNIGRRQQQQQQPPDVEVFNLWDILTSMDRQMVYEQRKIFNEKKQQKRSGGGGGKFSSMLFLSTTTKITNTLIKPFIERYDAVWNAYNTIPSLAELTDITFIPDSRAIQYKTDIISSRGNGKARLRPMR